MLKIYKSRNDFCERFDSIRNELHKILGPNYVIEHVGSTAVVGVDGKGIIDILVGARDAAEISQLEKLLIANGYFPAKRRSDVKDHAFLASTEKETTFGDTHVHLAVVGSPTFNDFIKVRNYFQDNPKSAQEYSRLKHQIAEESGYEREVYKKIKSKYIEDILSRENK